MKRYSFFAFFFLTLAFLFKANGQVVINEYSAGNKSQYADATGEYEDWVELYNAGASGVNIGGYHLTDNHNDPLKWTIPAGQTIAAGAFRIFICSSRDGVYSAQFHTNFKLTQSSSNEEICLTNTSGAIVDSLSLKTMRRNHSRGRTTNGAATWGVFQTPTPNASNNAQTANPAYVPMVQFSLQAGFYSGNQSLTLSCAQPNTSIYYTTNGGVPTNVASATNLLYSGPITLTTTKPVRARAFDNSNSLAGSFTVTNTFFLNEPSTGFPIYSIASNQMTGGSGFFSTGNETMISIEYFSAIGQRIFQMEGDLRQHGNDSWNYAQKGMRFYVRDEYGYANKIDNKMFPTSPRTDFDVIIIKAAGSDNYPGNNGPSCHTRDAYVQTLSEKFNLDLDVRRFKNAITFINGQYWGVYESRERIDKDYTEYYYDNGQKWVDMLAYWGNMQIEEGSDTAWNNLFNYIVANNMANAAPYNYVMQRLDPMSLIDYFVLNTYTVNSDWLNWNTAWWRGRKPGQEVRWRYRLWDEDNTFDLGENYTGLPTTNNTGDPCDVQTIPAFANTNDPHEGHVRIFNKLMLNTGFKQLYVNRYADLINTAFYCPNMLNHFDTMIARLQPEMQRQCTRWGGSYTTWQQQVLYTRNQISGRCNNVVSTLGACYNLTGPYHVAVNVYPACAGTVTLNTTTPGQYPFTGNYYGGVYITLKAHPATGWQFDHWQLVGHTPQPNANADSIWFDLGTSGDSIVAVYTQINPVPATLHVIVQGNNPGAVLLNGAPVVNGQNVTYNIGTQVNVSATPLSGCTFNKWLLNHTLVYPVDTMQTGYFCFMRADTLTVIFDQCNVTADSLTVIIQQPGYGTVSINSIAVPFTPVTIPVNANTLLNIAATPTAGYTFLHWQLAHHTITPNTTSAAASFTFTQRDTLFAIFKAPDTFSLTVNVNPSSVAGNVSINGNTPGSYPTVLKFVSGTAINIAALANTGYSFVNWSILHHTLNPGNTSANANFSITQNDTLIGFFVANPNPPDTFNLTVMVNPLPGGNVSVNGTTPPAYPTVVKIVDGTLVNIAAAANVGYTFANWVLLHHAPNPNANTANASFVITQNDTLLANFIATAPDTFDLTVMVTPLAGGNVSVNGTTPGAYPTVLKIVDGTTVNVVATPLAGYTFTNWTMVHHALTPNNASANASFAMAANDTLLAVFTPIAATTDTFDLVVQLNLPGAGTVSVNGTVPGAYPFTFRLQDGTVTNIFASANAGYVFDSWVLNHHAISPNNTTTLANFTITQRDTLTAKFNKTAADTFRLVLRAFPTNGGSITVNGNTYSNYPTTLFMPDNTLLNIGATANPTFQFLSWHVVYGTPLPTDSANPMNFTIHQDDTVYAFFQAAAIPDTFNVVVQAMPANGGSITVNTVTYTNYPGMLRVQDSTLLNVSQVPNPGFSFLNWQLINHTPSPNDTANPMNFNVYQSDTIYAWYRRDSIAIVVDVSPKLAGTVTVAGFTPTWYPHTFVLEAAANKDFAAAGKTIPTTNKTYYYQFDHYEFIYHTPSPDNTTPIVFINVQYPDTVIAYFIDSPPQEDTVINVLIPSGFSPNNDGMNDIFRVVGEPMSVFNMQIYNRWGQRVFLSNTQGYGWSGDFKGEPCDIGVYTYILTGQTMDGEDVKMKGTITLIR